MKTSYGCISLGCNWYYESPNELVTMYDRNTGSVARNFDRFRNEKYLKDRVKSLKASVRYWKKKLSKITTLNVEKKKVGKNCTKIVRTRVLKE
jgi:hypothetical protein